MCAITEKYEPKKLDSSELLFSSRVPVFPDCPECNTRTCDCHLTANKHKYPAQI